MDNNLYKEIFDFNTKKNILLQNILKIYPKLPNIPDISTKLLTPNEILNTIRQIKNNLNSIKQYIIQEYNISNRYLKQYNNNDNMYWGIGLENETYLQGKSTKILGKNIINMIGRERYSVNYTKNYNIENVKNVMSNVYLPNKYYNISQMLNSHSLDKIDRYGEHKTTYQKEPIDNIKFSGKSVLDEWFEYDNEISEKMNSKNKLKTNIFFDGDTIEFITENFYKTNSKDVINELINTKKWFIDKFNDFKEKTNLWNDLGILDFVSVHPGLNIFKSMSNKIVFFNNTTIHIHLTLPTKLKDGLIYDKTNFNNIHSRAIKLLQWFEPFFICTLGSPDIMQTIFEKYYNTNTATATYFSNGSMRATISRYIGIGIYDTTELKSGKILTRTIDESRPKYIKWWRDMINDNLQYVLPEKDIGLDFNYEKHYQSGIEFRLLDGIPLNILKDVLDIILLICEYSYKNDNIVCCNNSQTWNNLVYKSLVYGDKAIINMEEINDFLMLLKIDMNKNITNDMYLEDFYYMVLEYLYDLYKNKDTCVLKYMTKEFDKINRWNNFNKLQKLEHMKSLNAV